MPESGITYVGDWRTPLSHWWVDNFKSKSLQKAKDSNTSLTIQPTIIDYWNRIK